MNGWALIIVLCLLVVLSIVARHIYLLRRGWHNCASRGCGRLHPPSTVKVYADKRSFLSEQAEDWMAAKRHMRGGEE